MYRSILGAHACVLSILCLFTLLPWLGRMGWQEPTVSSRTVIALVLLGTAVDVVRRGERMTHLAFLCTTFLLLTPVLGTNPVPNDSTVGMTLSAVGIMGARLLPLIQALGLVAVLSGIHVATVHVLDSPQTGLSLDALVLSLGTAVAAVVFVNAMQASAIETERMTQANRARERELARSEAELAARTASRRILHDDVLGTLHLLSDAAASADRTRRQCAATVAAIRRVVASSDDDREPTVGARGTQDTTELLPGTYSRLIEELRETSPTAIAVDVVGRLQRLPPLDASQHAVLVRALLEGARNAVRHGRVSEVVLRISADRRDVRWELLDRGSGLAPDLRLGFGFRESVERPVVDLGGRAALLPRPGGGAALVVTLPRDQRDGGRLHYAHGLMDDGLGSVRRLSRTVAMPLAAAWCVIAVHSALQGPFRWPSLIVGLGWLALTLAIVREAEHGSPGPGWLARIAVSTLVLQVVGIVVLPEGAMLDFRSWSIGMSALPLVVFVLSPPMWVGATVVMAHVAVVLAAPQIDPGLTGGLVPWGSLNAVITCPVSTMVLGSLIRRQGRALGDQRRREYDLDLRRAAEEWQAATTDLYFAHVRLEVLPWLEEIASGERDPVDPETRAQARLFAVAARDDLYAPGFFDEGLRADVAQFRRHGGAVELRAGLPPGGFERPVGHVLRGLLRVSAGRRIIVSPPVEQGQQIRISVVPSPHEGDLERLRSQVVPGVEFEVDAFRAVLLVDDLPVSG